MMSGRRTSIWLSALVVVILAAGIFLAASAFADVAPAPGTPVAALPEHFEKRIVATGGVR